MCLIKSPVIPFAKGDKNCDMIFGPRDQVNIFSKSFFKMLIFQICQSLINNNNQIGISEVDFLFLQITKCSFLIKVPRSKKGWTFALIWDIFS